MFLPTLRELLKTEWQQLRARRALPCLVAILASLAAGLSSGHPGAGMVAASGAMSVGFGSFQWLGRSRVAPMLWVTVGMAVSAVAGSLVGHSGPGAVINAAAAGFGAGILLALGPGASWIGQQCAIVALVASGYPVGWETAVSRAGLILAGGTLQTLIMLATWRVRKPQAAPDEPDPFEGVLPALRTLRANLTPTSDAWHYAWRQAVTLAVGAELEHATGLPNGYWVPMTALLVLRPAFQPTFHRGVLRVLGTVGGAALATLLVRELRLDPLTVGAMTVLFAWAAYALVNVNYGLFAVFLTAYIVFLLDFGGLSTRVVVAHRTLNTALGGSLALLSYVTVLIRRKRHPTGQHEPTVRPPSLDLAVPPQGEVRINPAAEPANR